MSFVELGKLKCIILFFLLLESPDLHISQGMISKITDKILPEVNEWQQ